MKSTSQKVCISKKSTLIMAKPGASYLGTVFFMTAAILLIYEAQLGSCGSILLYMPFVSKSMKITFMPIAEEMATRGHEVVVVMPYQTKKPNPKIKEIIVEGKEFTDMTDRVSEQKLKTGADANPPLLELINTALLVSIYPHRLQGKFIPN